MLSSRMLCGVLVAMGELIVVGFCVGFVVSTCANFTSYALAQVMRLIRLIR